MININGTLSTSEYITRGLLQGTVLFPLLFNVPTHK